MLRPLLYATIGAAIGGYVVYRALSRDRADAAAHRAVAVAMQRHLDDHDAYLSNMTREERAERSAKLAMYAALHPEEDEISEEICYA